MAPQPDEGDEEEAQEFVLVLDHGDGPIRTPGTEPAEEGLHSGLRAREDEGTVVLQVLPWVGVQVKLVCRQG